VNLVELRHAFDNDAKPATFRADGAGVNADAPRVLVYPLKNGAGFLWLLMIGDITKIGTRAVQSGGIERRYQVAVASAVHALMGQIDK